MVAVEQAALVVVCEHHDRLAQEEVVLSALGPRRAQPRSPQLVQAGVDRRGAGRAPVRAGDAEQPPALVVQEERHERRRRRDLGAVGGPRPGRLRYEVLGLEHPRREPALEEGLELRAVLVLEQLDAGEGELLGGGARRDLAQAGGRALNRQQVLGAPLVDGGRRPEEISRGVAGGQAVAVGEAHHDPGAGIVRRRAQRGRE